MTPPVSNKDYDQTHSAQRLFLEFHSFLSLNFTPELLPRCWLAEDPDGGVCIPLAETHLPVCRNGSEQENSIIQCQKLQCRCSRERLPRASAPPSPLELCCCLALGFLLPLPPCVGLSDFVANIIWLIWNRDISKQKQEPVLGAAEVHCRTGFHFSLVHCSSPLHWENGISCAPVSRNWRESNAEGAREVGRWQLLCKSCLVLVLLGHTLARKKEIELILTG